MHNKVKQHLAIATGAAAAIPMGLKAAIIYEGSTPLTATYGGPTVEWDVDGTGGSDFALKPVFGFSANKLYFSSAGGRNGRGFVGPTAGGDDFSNMGSGKRVAPLLTGGYQWGASGINYRSILKNYNVASEFKRGQIGSNFVGFRFLSGTDMLYGWAALTLTSSSVTIERWAYNDTPDGSIEVGVPAPPTLVLLAAGLYGVRRWRRSRPALS